MVNLIIGVIFLAMAILELIIGDMNILHDYITYWGSLIISNIYFTSTK